MNRQDAIDVLYTVINSGILDRDIIEELIQIAATLRYHETFEGNSRDMAAYLGDLEGLREEDEAIH